jgi:hypothetical protein
VPFDHLAWLPSPSPFKQDQTTTKNPSMLPTDTVIMMQELLKTISNYDGSSEILLAILAVLAVIVALFHRKDYLPLVVIV